MPHILSQDTVLRSMDQCCYISSDSPLAHPAQRESDHQPGQTLVLLCGAALGNDVQAGEIHISKRIFDRPKCVAHRLFAGVAVNQETHFFLLQLTLQELSGRAGIKPRLFWLDSCAGKGCRL